MALNAGMEGKMTGKSMKGNGGMAEVETISRGTEEKRIVGEESVKEGTTKKGIVRKNAADKGSVKGETAKKGTVRKNAADKGSVKEETTKKKTIRKKTAGKAITRKKKSAGRTGTKRKPTGGVAIKHVAAKKKLAQLVIERLKQEYPEAGCTLDYNEAWKLLVSVRLAAQCTDARVNVVVVGLYEKFPDVAALAAAPVEEIEEIVRPCGLGRSKARDISACMKVLLEKYEGHVPEDFDALLALPGVGRKSANLIMGDVFGKAAIVTDTHCIRLVNRMGLVDGIKEPKKVEMALWEIIPAEEGSDFCHRVVEHGRAVCTARTNPYCDKCCLNDICAKRI